MCLLCSGTDSYHGLCLDGAGGKIGGEVDGPRFDPVVVDPFADDGPFPSARWLPQAASAPLGAEKPSKTTEQAADQITRHGFSWNANDGQPLTITYAYRLSKPGYTEPGEGLTNSFRKFTPDQITATEAVLGLFDEVTNVNFVRVSTGGNTANAAYSNNASILYGSYQTGQSFAFAYLPTPGATASNNQVGDVWTNVGYADNRNVAPGSYGFLTLLHETGHALGLEHPGDYNAAPGVQITYANDAEYLEDDRQYTIMSYFDAEETGADHGGVFARTLLIHDIAALQKLYGVDLTTRAGNTTYGFHSNAGSAYLLSSANEKAVFAIWDGGGIDTLDFSENTGAQAIDLRAEAFSSVGGLTYNISIARGAVIENAIGGWGADTIIGNAADNVLRGSAGNDVLDGGDGEDTAYFTGAKGNYTITRLSDDVVRVVDGRAGANDGIDLLQNMELARFSDGTVTLAPQPPTGLVPSSVVRVNEAARNGTAVTTFAVTDPDASGSNAHTFSLVNDAGGRFAIDATTGRLTVADGPLLDFEQATSHSIVVRATDAEGLTYDESFSVQILNVSPENVAGGEGADTFIGDVGNDRLTGNGGADLLRGGGGNDVLDGGVGQDTAYFTGFRSNYTITELAPGVIRVTDNRAGSPDGTDQLRNIELARFADKTITLPLQPPTDLVPSGPVRVNEVARNGTPVTTFTVADPDASGSNAHTFSLVDDASGRFVINATTGRLTVANGLLLDFEQAVSHDVTVRATDVDGLTYDETFSVQILDVTPENAVGGSGVDHFVGGNGPDRLTGNGGADILEGGAANDVITGGTGADEMYGGSGNDRFYVDNAGDLVIEAAGGGSDTIYTEVSYTLRPSTPAAPTAVESIRANYTGTSGISLTGNEFANLIYGGAASDILNGGDGNDKLYANGGGDELTGGLGRDTLYGGVGADSFVFHTVAESAAGAYDYIQSFKSAEGDIIDLADIFAGTLDFIGTESFSGNAGELRTTYTSGRAVVSVDVDGDRAADFSLTVYTPAALGAADFVL